MPSAWRVFAEAAEMAMWTYRRGSLPYRLQFDSIDAEHVGLLCLAIGAHDFGRQRKTLSRYESCWSMPNLRPKAAA